MVVSLCAAGVLSIYAGLRCRRQGSARAVEACTGFFVVSCYLDGIFFLIMQGVLPGSSLPAAGLGFFVSKSIPIAALVALAGRRGGEAVPSAPGGRRGGETVSSASGGRRADGKRASYMENAPDREGKSDWQYLDGLTVAITLLFGLPVPVCLWAAENISPADGRFAIVLLLLCLLLLLLGYYASLFWHRGRERERRRRMAAEAGKEETDRYLERAEDNYRRMRELWHDLKNHISLLTLLLQEEKYGEMADYLKVFGEDVDSLSLPEKSGNPIVDALLADKIARARREGIAVELSLCDMSKLSLAPNEICAILGNLLDNALEANRKAAEGRFLSVECRKREECYYIRIQNAAGGQARRQGNLFGTDKTGQDNRVGHGLGLRSVERTVHGCGGELVLDSRSGRFTAVVRLPK